MHHLSDLSLIVPVGVRILALLSSPIFHFAFHRTAEKLIHLSTHHVGILKRATKAIRFIPDLLMIVSLIALHICSGESIRE